MQSPSTRMGMLHRVEQHGMRKEVAGRDQLVDARDVHMHHTSGADVQVPDFAIAHLTFGKADKRTASLNQRVGKVPQKAIIGGLPRKSDGIGLSLGAVTPAVENDEDERIWSHRSVLMLLGGCRGRRF